MKQCIAPLAVLVLLAAFAPGCAGTHSVTDNPDGGAATDRGSSTGGDLYVPPMGDRGVNPIRCKINHPPRAAMLGGSAAVTIKGKVLGPLSNLGSVKVNGKKVQTMPGGDFSLPVTSKWGLNIITAECVDKSGTADRKVQAYHWSSKYWPNTGTGAAVKLPRGLLARLYQKAIDDGDRSTLNDLASILVKVINNLDFDKLIPSTLVSGKYKVPPWGPTISYSVTKNGKFKINPFSVNLTTRNGGLRVTGKTSYLELPVKAKAGVTVSGKVKISNLSMSGDINISKKSGGTVQVSVPRLDMNYSSLKVEIGSGIIGSITSAITSGISSLFKNSILKLMENEVKQAIPGPVKSFVTGFKFAQSFQLPALLGSKSLSIYTDLDTILFDPDGGSLGLNTAVYATKGIASGKLGTIATNGTFTAPGKGSTAMLVAMRHDTLNQVVNATWLAGALKQDVSKLISDALKSGSVPLPFTINSLKLELDALLPPVLKPGKGQSDFELQVGDLKLKVNASVKDALGNPGTIKADVYVSATTTGAVSLSSSNVLKLTVSTTLGAYEVEIANLVVTGGGTTLGKLFVVLIRDMVKALLPQLGPNIVQSFPLPAIDLSSLGGSYGIPKGTTLKIKSGKLSQQNGYLVFSGELG